MHRTNNLQAGAEKKAFPAAREASSRAEYDAKISLIYENVGETFCHSHMYDDVTEKSLRVNLFIIHVHTFAKLNI